jgi:glyoxylase-like metal-dependent hydrolase (beta-lactamase superfamily II)
MRVLRPYPHILGFYDGRLDGQRIHSDQPNWLDDGAFTLGVCSYAILDGPEALVFDTHISLAHARAIRTTLEAEGARNIRVILSHHHDDHIAGTEIFADCEIFAGRTTAELLEARREEIETGDPPIKPLVMPNSVFDGVLTLTVGSRAVEIHPFDIHSRDGHVGWLPRQRILLAGDTLEDPVTYVAEPDRLETHLEDLDRLSGWPIDKILPNHGAPEVIEAGGFDSRLIAATQAYVAALLRCADEPELAALDLKQFAAAQFADGSIHYYPSYEETHRRNIRAVTERRS